MAGREGVENLVERWARKPRVQTRDFLLSRNLKKLSTLLKVRLCGVEAFSNQGNVTLSTRCSGLILLFATQAG